MTPFNRAMLYLRRKRSRGIILTIIFFVAAFLLITSFTIKSCVDCQARYLTETLGANFKAEISDETFTAYYDPVSGYTGEYMYMDDLESILQNSRHVTDYYIEDSGERWTDLKLKPASWASWRREMKSYDYTDDDLINLQGETYEYYDISAQTTMVKGCSNSSLNEYFLNGAYSLVEGRHITKEDQQAVLISEELANRNKLSVGDTFTIQKKDFVRMDNGSLIIEDGAAKKDWGKPYEVEIVGIFSINFRQTMRSSGNLTLTLESAVAENEIFCDYETYINSRYTLLNGSEQVFPLSFARFYVDSPDNLDAAIESAKSSVDTKYITIAVDDTEFAENLAPLKQLSKFSVIIILVSVAATVIVIGLVVNMWVKSRKRETGILLSIGEKKSGIIAQYMIETVATGLFGFLMAVIVASALIPLLGNVANGIVSPAEGAPLYEAYDEAGLHGVQVAKISAPVDLEYSITFTAAVLAGAIVMLSGIVSVLLSAQNILSFKLRNAFSKR